MVDYKTMKAALEQQCESAKYFTDKFYAMFISEKNMSFEHFLRTGIWGRLATSEASEFYNKNGGAWCVMLELYEASIPEWRVDFCEKESGTYNVVQRKHIRLETEEQARKWAEVVCPPDCVYEINAIAHSAEQPKINKPGKDVDR